MVSKFVVHIVLIALLVSLHICTGFYLPCNHVMGHIPQCFALMYGFSGNSYMHTKASMIFLLPARGVD